MATELLIYTARKRKNFVFEDFTADDHILAVSESGTYTFDDGSGETLVNPLEAVFFEKGIRFFRKTVTPVTIHLFRFRSDEKIFDGHHIKFINTERILSTISLLKKLNRSIPLQNDFTCKSRLFADILNLYKIENAHRTTESGVPDPLIENALDILGKNYHNKMSLPDISEALGISYVQFSRRFKSAMGITPFEYLANLRLNQAQHLLTTTDLTIREIAPLCGFENEYYFSNFFKKYKNISPSRFRTDI